MRMSWRSIRNIPFWGVGQITPILSKGVGGDDEIYVYKYRTRRRLTAIQQIGGTITSSIDEQLMYQLIAKKASEVVDATGSRLMLLVPRQREFDEYEILR